ERERLHVRQLRVSSIAKLQSGSGGNPQGRRDLRGHRMRLDLLYMVPAHTAHEVQALVKEAGNLLNVPALTQRRAVPGKQKRRYLWGLVTHRVGAVSEAAAGITRFQDLIVAPAPHRPRPTNPLAVVVGIKWLLQRVGGARPLANVRAPRIQQQV